MRLLLPVLALLLITPAALASATINHAEIETMIETGQAKSAAALLERELDQTAEDVESRYWLARAEIALIDTASPLRKALLARSAKKHLLAVVEARPRHAPALESLAMFCIEAPGFVGGSIKQARQTAGQLLDVDASAGYRVMAAIAREEEDYLSQVRMLQASLEAGGWNWPAQYRIVVTAVHRELDNTSQLLKKARADVHQHVAEPGRLLALLDYQQGKYAALTGTDLKEAADALHRYLKTTPGEQDPDLVWAEFRLAQVERQLQMTDTAIARLARLDRQDLPDDLGFALRDERRWHYDD